MKTENNEYPLMNENTLIPRLNLYNRREIELWLRENVDTSIYFDDTFIIGDDYGLDLYNAYKKNMTLGDLSKKIKTIKIKKYCNETKKRKKNY
jgi:hypothetical protein